MIFISNSVMIRFRALLRTDKDLEKIRPLPEGEMIISNEEMKRFFARRGSVTGVDIQYSFKEVRDVQ